MQDRHLRGEAARVAADSLRAGDDGYYHEAILEDLDDLCRRIADELEQGASEAE